MQVWKFGGTSVGKPERMKSIRDLVTANDTRKIVVLSALSGTTNALLGFGEALTKGDKTLAKNDIAKLKEHYENFISELFSTEQGLAEGNKIIEKEFNFILSLLDSNIYTPKHDKKMVAQGEIMSTQLFTAYMKEQGESVVLLPALEFMSIDSDGEPLFKKIGEKLSAMLKNQSEKVLVTQGFICRNPRGEVDNLKRGGSDYTASLIGGAIKAEEIQIWTDIDGMHNNDPRIVKRTFPVRELLFEEAAELAYFGAKILHPSTITPAKMGGVPVRLKNTMAPDAPGTLITSKNSTEGSEIKAIAAKDNITAIYIHSTRMLNAYGFLRKVFEVFEKYKTPVDMITTSEVSVAVTIDNSERLEGIRAELTQFADMEDDDRNQSIICIVGNFLADKSGIAIKILEAVKHIPIRMISYGASEHNISLLVDSVHKNDALEALNEGLFQFD